jgi:hypothetical protein
MKMRKYLFVILLSMVLAFSGCCSANYKLYVDNMDKDLKELRPMVEGYVNSDERLSSADRKARMSVLDEMEKRTEVAKKDVE